MMTSAHYFDGRHARAHAVELAVADGLLTLRGDVERSYDAAATRIAEPFAHAPTVLYFADGARCELADAGAGRALREALGYRATRVVRLTRHTWAALAALVLLVALILAMGIWGVPAAATRLADALPPSADRALGESALQALHTGGTLAESRLSDQWLAEVGKAFERVRPPDLRVRLLVRQSRSLGANAIALPDGTIVMTDLMVRLVAGKAGEFGEVQQAQLAGVLAHEIGHVRMRHGARILAGSSLSAALAASLFGDFSGVAAVPAAVVGMRYSREMEAEADEYAIALMKQKGIPMLPLARLLERIDSGGAGTRGEDEDGDGDEDEDGDEDGNGDGKKDENEAREWLWEAADSLLRSHPLTEQRAARLRAAALDQDRMP